MVWVYFIMRFFGAYALGYGMGNLLIDSKFTNTQIAIIQIIGFVLMMIGFIPFKSKFDKDKSNG